MKHRTINAALPITVFCAATAFSLPARAQVKVWPTALTNVAAAANGARIAASSSTLDDDPKFGADNLIDGQIYNAVKQTGSLGWASNKYDPIDMDAVTLSFADNRTIQLGKIVLNPTVAVAAERWAKDVEVQVSSDSVDGPYRTVAQLTLRKLPEPQEFTILPTPARFVRLLFRSNWGSDRAVALGEVEIYEAINTDDPLGGLIARLEGAVKELRIYQQTQVQLAGTRRAENEVEDVPIAAELSSATKATLQMVQLDEVAAPAAPKTAAVSNQNLAAAKNGGRIVNFSSVFNKNEKEYGPQNLIDGDNFQVADNKGSFGWASEGFKPGQEYVTIGFAGDKIHSIGKVALNPVSNQSQLRWARTVVMQVTSSSPKDGPWRTIETFNLNPDPFAQEFSFNPVEARYVRFVFAANGPASLALPNADPRVISDRSVSLGEIEIYEPVVREDNLDQLISKVNQIAIDLKQVYAANLLVPKESKTKSADAEIAPEEAPQNTLN